MLRDGAREEIVTERRSLRRHHRPVRALTFVVVAPAVSQGDDSWSATARGCAWRDASGRLLCRATAAGDAGPARHAASVQHAAPRHASGALTPFELATPAEPPLSRRLKPTLHAAGYASARGVSTFP